MSTAHEPPRHDENGSTRSRRVFARLQQIMSGRRRTVIPYASYREASQAASGRRLHLMAAMRQELLRQFPTEHPPLRHSRERRVVELSPREAADRAYWLRHEMESEPLLLIGRVADTVAAIVQDVAAYSDEPFQNAWKNLSPSVSLQLVPKFRMRARSHTKQFPYCAVISSRHPEVFVGYLRSIAEVSPDWFGIGVDVEQRRPPTPLGHCKVPGGRSGRIGGILTVGEVGDLGVTCAHVISPGCYSAEFVEEYRESMTAPDLALLSLDQECFDIPSKLRAVHPL